MKKVKLFVSGLFVLVSFTVNAQGKIFTKSGKISFFSSSPLENIAASNKSAVCLLDTKTGDLQFALLMKGFEFKKALMQEHFNNEFAESNKYPKSEFRGQITNNSTVKYDINGIYTVTVKGRLTIHGETKDIETTGTITIKDGKALANSTFNILLADYKISIPRLYRDNISNSIKITVDCALDPLK